MDDKVILHSDANNFYASVECLHRPAIRDLPVIVGGDPELRHGIVLAKNYLAKAAGIQTGEALFQARQKCPNLVVIHPNYKLYLRFARLIRKIYADYTDLTEAFGLDESFLDVSDCCRRGRTGLSIANEIRERIKREVGVTVSVGVSFNKVYAKLGSDLKKPDATTLISRENYRDVVWNLPVEELLYVGRATKQKLHRFGIYTIGQLAGTDELFLRSAFGKWGDVLHAFSNGSDLSPVLRTGEEAAIKSIGNSTTTPRDLVNNDDVRFLLFILCDSVAARLREHGFRARTVTIHVRDNTLFSFERQMKLPRPTNLASELSRAAMDLFERSYSWLRPIRSIGMSGCDLVGADTDIQLSLLEDEERILKLERLESAIDSVRNRFGNKSVRRAVLLADPGLNQVDPKAEHVIFPVGYFKGGALP